VITFPVLCDFAGTAEGIHDGLELVQGAALREQGGVNDAAWRTARAGCRDGIHDGG
jgi:hypothetical protein